MKNYLLLISGILLLIVAIGCGGGASKSSAPVANSTAPSATSPTPPPGPTPSPTPGPGPTPTPGPTPSPTPGPTPSPSPGNKWFITPNGGDNNDCKTVNTACATFQHVDSLVQPGDSVHVQPGTYNQTITLNASGNSSNSITWISDVKWGAAIVGTSTNNNFGQIEVQGNFVIIQGFDVTSSNTNAVVGIGVGGGNDKILGNRVHDLGNSVCNSNGGAGIVDGQIGYSNTTQAHNTFNQNFIFNVGDEGCGTLSGIYIQELGDVAQNNIVINTGTIGIQSWHAATSVNISNNTVVNDPHNGQGIILGAGDAGNQTNNNSVVANNIVIGSSNEGYSEQGSTGSGNRFFNNLGFNNGQDIVLQTGQSSGFIHADPQFVNGQLTGGGGDYHVASTSPAINAGIGGNGTPTSDFDGAPRPVGSGPDIGPYEFGSTPSPWPWM